MKRFYKIIAGALAFLLALSFMGAYEPAVNAEAATKMKRSAFIVATVKAMKGLKNASGQTLNFTLNKDGSVSYAGKTIKADTVNALKKKYGTSLEASQYIAIAADMGLIKTSASAYKTKKAMAKKVTLKVALGVLVNADAYLYGTKFSSEDLKLTKSRISNLKKAGSSAYQTIMAKAYALGIYVGTKDGDYKTTRTLKYGSKLTTKTANSYIAKAVDKSKRTGITDDFQVIRTTKLPKTADLYPYILDSYPNAYYDTAWTSYGAYKGGTNPYEDINNVYYYKYSKMSFKDKLKDGHAYYMPAEYILYCQAGDNECVVSSEYRQIEAKYKALDEAIEFYKHAMNVDYRIIKNDTSWYKFMNKYLSKTDLDTYIENCIKNKTIVECDVVAGDKSTLYKTDTGRFKVYLHFRVVSDKIIETNGDWSTSELVPVITDMENESRGWLMYYFNYKLGEWIDYYVSPGIGYGDKLGRCDLNAELMINYYGLYPWLIDLKD